MAYTPKTWQCGEPIMADDLNHMEQGIAQGGSVAPLIVHFQAMTAAEITEAGLTGVTVGDAFRLDTPTTTIKQAFQSGRMVLLVTENEEYWQTTALIRLDGSSDDGNGGLFGRTEWQSPSDYPYLVSVLSEAQQ